MKTPAFVRWLEPWFSAYALAGLLVNGMVPVLLPLTAHSHGATVVGLVVAAFFTGQLTAPFVGSWADRAGKQREVFLGSFPVMAAAAIALGLTHAPVYWCIIAALAGAAAGAAQTLGSVFIVEGHPHSEWDMRIGWFRLTFGLGQVAGLTIGAVFAEGRIEMGWIAAGGAIFLGTFLGRIHLPALRRTNAGAAAKRASSTLPGRRTSKWDAVLRELKGKFGRFLATWSLAMIAVQTILNVIPLIMRDAFMVGPSHAATVYLIGSIGGALLYPVCGAIVLRRGAGVVLAIGMIGTLLAFGAMTYAWLGAPHHLKSAIAIGALVLIALAYPFDYVGGTMLAAELTLDGEGSAMGLFNSAVAGGAIIGAIAPSFLAKGFGYGSLPPLSAGLMGLALLIGTPVLFRRPSARGRPETEPSDPLSATRMAAEPHSR